MSQDTRSSIPSKTMMAGIVDHTFLKTHEHGLDANQQREHIRLLVEEAHQGGAYSVCVREPMVAYAHELIYTLQSKLKITSVIGFPHGDEFTTEEKVEFLRKARTDGAHEFDMVIRYRDLQAGRFETVRTDVKEVSQVAGEQVLKVIIETAYLNESQKLRAYELVLEAFEMSGARGQRFLKTSTGFAKPQPGTAIGATLPDVVMMHKLGQGQCGIKPAGGIANYAEALQFFQAVGSPMLADLSGIHPMKFRIGSSSLLRALLENNTAPDSY